MSNCDFECKVCGCKPDKEGWAQHSRGCFQISEDGGGMEYFSEADQADGHAQGDT